MKQILITALVLIIYAHVFPEKVLANGKGMLMIIADQDTSKPTKDSSGAKAAMDAPAKATKEGTSLLQKIAKPFKFKSNKRDFIIKTVDSFHFTDTIQQSSSQIKAQIDTVAKAENEQFRQLSKQIDSLNLVVNKTKPDTTSHDNPKPHPVVIKPEPVVVQDSTGTIAPVALLDKEAATVESNNNKPQVLSLIKQIVAVKQQTSDSIANILVNNRLGSYTLHKKIDICAYYNANSNYKYTNNHFGILSTLIYDSLYTLTQKGNIKKLRYWVNDSLVAAAKKEGCSIIYTINCNNKYDLSAFLTDRNAIENFATDIVMLQKDHQANGININFTALDTYNRDLFTEFIRYLSDLIRKPFPQFKIFITIPVYDRQKAYDVKALAPFVSRFCIDFSTNLFTRSAPLAPQSGKGYNTMSTSIAYYLNQQVSPDKFMVNLSYRGVKWIITRNSNKQDYFLQYLSYAAIRNKVYAMVMYDALSNSAIIDTSYIRDSIIGRTWFDDENTLSDKYDFILQSGLGGVGFSYLGDDGNYGELWDELVYKFMQVDSVSIRSPHVAQLSFFERIARRFSLYNFILQNPCEPCFYSDNQKAYKNDSLQVYIRELKIDSLVNKLNTQIARLNKRTDTKHQLAFLTTFTYLTKELNTIFFFISLLFLLVILGFTYTYIRYTKQMGEQWKYRKLIGWILVISSFIFLWGLFNYLFTNDLIPFFGVNTDGHSTSMFVNPLSYNAQNNIDCQPDSDCINIPLNTLQGILIIAAIVGILLTKYLLFPLFKKEDIP
jgi:spore germination protein YaaH